MLIPLIGAAGTGKTTRILDKIKELAQQQESILLLVPEQYSFEMERRITRELPVSAVLCVQVMSFTRLCHRTFQTYGGGAGERITEPAKRMLINQTLDIVKDQLVQYRRAAADSRFIESVLMTMEQFKNAGVSPADLQEFSEHTSDQALKEKTGELFQIYGVYQSRIEDGYIDERDDTIRCAHILSGKNHFKDTIVFLDSFRDFTPSQRELIRVIMASCKDIYLSVLAKSLFLSGKNKEQTENDVFRIVKENAMHLILDAREQAIPIAAPVMCSTPLRYQDDALAYLEQMLTQLCTEPYSQETNAIAVYQAQDPYEELCFTAAQIAHLVKNEKMQYRDITIIARSLEPYKNMMEHLFSRYQIPIFWDFRLDIQSVPVVSALLDALNAVSSKFDTGHVLSLAKSPLLGLPYTQVLLLENYCYVWSISKEQWNMEFQNHPKGLQSEFSDSDLETLEIINHTAKAVMEPLLHLSEALKDCDGLQFARAVYDYLEEIHAKENLRTVYQQENLFHQQILLENDEAWNVLMDLLDTMATILKGVTLPLERFLDLFAMGIRCSDFGAIPNTLDQVAVGTADRIRPNEPKVVFVLGMNQGEFPPQLKEQGFFSDGEREQLAEAGIRLSPTVIRQNSYEQLYLYSALTAASHRLYITYHQTLLHGEECTAAPMIRELRKVFGSSNFQNRQSLPKLFFAVNEDTAFDQLCRQYRTDDGLTSALCDFVKAGERASSLSRLSSVLEKKDFVLRRREMARMLFGETMRLSPSRVEKYFSCPFAYFCSAGLGLRARRKVEFSPMESGSVIHYVLEKMVSQHGGKGLAALTRQELEQESMTILQIYLHSRISQEELLSKRFQYLYQNLARQMARLLEQLAREFVQSDFEPCSFELPISQNSPVKPMIFETADGVRVAVEGVVDRVDLMEKDGVRYVRVVDYKSGGKSFQLDDVYYGLNLQMLLYLFSIWRNGTGEFQDVLPGGVLYMPAKDPVVSVERNADEKKILQEKMKKYKMNGLILEDPVCIEGMEHEAAGLYIPAKMKEGKLDARSSVANLAQMGQICSHIESLLKDMAASLTKGKIEARPVQRKTIEPCCYCDFKSICQHQKDDKVRAMTPLGKNGFFDRIAKEDKQDEQ